MVQGMCVRAWAKGPSEVFMWIGLDKHLELAVGVDVGMDPRNIWD